MSLQKDNNHNTDNSDQLDTKNQQNRVKQVSEYFNAKSEKYMITLLDYIRKYYMIDLALNIFSKKDELVDEISDINAKVDDIISIEVDYNEENAKISTEEYYSELKKNIEKYKEIGLRIGYAPLDSDIFTVKLVPTLHGSDKFNQPKSYDLYPITTLTLKFKVNNDWLSKQYSKRISKIDLAHKLASSIINTIFYDIRFRFNRIQQFADANFSLYSNIITQSISNKTYDIDILNEFLGHTINYKDLLIYGDKSTIPYANATVGYIDNYQMLNGIYTLPLYNKLIDYEIFENGSEYGIPIPFGLLRVYISKMRSDINIYLLPLVKMFLVF